MFGVLILRTFASSHNIRCVGTRSQSRYVAQALERRAAELALALDVGEEADLVDVVAEGRLVARGRHDDRLVGVGAGVGAGVGVKVWNQVRARARARARVKARGRVRPYEAHRAVGEHTHVLDDRLAVGLGTDELRALVVLQSRGLGLGLGLGLGSGLGSGSGLGLGLGLLSCRAEARISEADAVLASTST